MGVMVTRSPPSSVAAAQTTDVSGFRVWGSGFRVSGFGFRVAGFGFRVSGVELRIYDLEVMVTRCTAPLVRCDEVSFADKYSQSTIL